MARKQQKPQRNPYHRYSQPTFDYSSAFSYRSSNFDGLDYGDGGEQFWLGESEDATKSDDLFQRLLYSLLITLSWLFVLFTFPVSGFFCVKRIQSLQRCLVYRLGRRLPLKGPGMILQLPFVDKISMIDLNENRFNLIEQEQQILTGDGSIILVKPCTAILMITNALLTSLRIHNVDIKHFLRLKFVNMLRSKHVEDLENRLDFILKEFEANMNTFINRWGYAIMMDQLPQINVVDRADPINPIKTKLKKLFDQTQASTEDESEKTLPNLLLNLLNPTPSAMNNIVERSEVVPEKSEPEQPPEHLMAVLRTFVSQYQTYLSVYDQFNIRVIIKDHPEDRVYHLRYDQNSLRFLTLEQVDPVQMTIQFNSQNDLNSFLDTKDVKYLNYKLH